MATLAQVEKIAQAVMASGNSQDVTITTVTTSKSFVVSTMNVGANRPRWGAVTVQIKSDGTAVEYRRNASPTPAVNVASYVVEFSAGVTVVRGSQSMSSASVDIDVETGGITDITKAFVIAYVRQGGSSYNASSAVFHKLFDDAGTNKLHLEVNTADATCVVEYQVVQHDGCSVQRFDLDSTDWTSTTSQVDVTLTSSSVTKSFGLISARYPTLSSGLGQGMFRGEQTSATNYRITRGATGIVITEMHLEVVTFTDDVVTEQITTSFAATENAASKTLTTLSATTKAMVIAPHGHGFGQSDLTADDEFGEQCFTAEITSTTNLDVDRNTVEDGSTASVTHVVIDLGATGGGGAVLAARGMISGGRLGGVRAGILTGGRI